MTEFFCGNSGQAHFFSIVDRDYDLKPLIRRKYCLVEKDVIAFGKSTLEENRRGSLGFVEAFQVVKNSFFLTSLGVLNLLNLTNHKQGLAVFIPSFHGSIQLASICLINCYCSRVFLRASNSKFATSKTVSSRFSHLPFLWMLVRYRNIDILVVIKANSGDVEKQCVVVVANKKLAVIFFLVCWDLSYSMLIPLLTVVAPSTIPFLFAPWISNMAQFCNGSIL